MPNWLANTLRIILAAALPVVLVLTNVRLLLTPLYINWEYNLPNFPADFYGFTTEDRLAYSRIALDYLLNDAGIEYLGDQNIPDDKGANPDFSRRYNEMYNGRELKHMLDVKNVVKAALAVWRVCGMLVVGAVVALGWGVETRPLLRSGLLIGSGATLGLLIALGLFIVFGFDAFFVLFHRVFFTGDTWLFRWSDTLIRLFPEKFWFDIFVWLAGGTLAEAAAIGAAAWWWLKAQ